MKSTTSFDSFAKLYDSLMKNKGDYTHQHTIDPALFKAIGNFKNKTVYDIACGNGYISRRISSNGAKEVWSSDISMGLISIAKTHYKTPKNNIKYFVADASDFSSLPQNYFDLVIMNVAIHFVGNIPRFVRGIKNILKTGGRFVFTTTHPLKPITIFDIKGEEILSQKEVLTQARRYLKSGPRTTFNIWTEQNNLKLFDAPISYYINHLSEVGFLVDKFIEPETKTTIEETDNSTTAFSEIPLVYALGARKI